VHSPLAPGTISRISASFEYHQPQSILGTISEGLSRHLLASDPKTETFVYLLSTASVNPLSANPGACICMYPTKECILDIILLSSLCRQAVLSAHSASEPHLQNLANHPGNHSSVTFSQRTYDTDLTICRQSIQYAILNPPSRE
jgi:hypothetical protein